VIMGLSALGIVELTLPKTLTNIKLRKVGVQEAKAWRYETKATKEGACVHITICPAHTQTAIIRALPNLLAAMDDDRMTIKQETK
jgi:hypothetical protein